MHEQVVLSEQVRVAEVENQEIVVMTARHEPNANPVRSKYSTAGKLQ
jgi:hypothetical protein